MIIPNITVIHEGDKMRIESLDIQGVGGIKILSLNFNKGLNVICGANGIGKTTILNIIADAFSSGRRNIKRNVMMKEGCYGLKLENHASIEIVKIKEFSPSEIPYSRNSNTRSNLLLNFNANRDIDYQKLSGVPGDTPRQDYDSGNMAVLGIQANDIKGWFSNRHLFSLQEKGFTEVMKRNLELAKSVFSLMDENIKFSYIDLRGPEILLHTNGGEIYFEYLSSGYKTCIYIILGILKELEYRFNSEIVFDEFDGIILIDEIDLHLHPTWQAQLIKALKEIFRKAQIIATTHSPSILQSLEKDEIIALGLDENDNTVVKELNLGEYGLQGWTLEEILQDVMGMPSTTSELYESTINEFDKAMDEENGSKIMEQYEILKKMLHPKNPLQKLLKLQVAEWEE